MPALRTSGLLFALPAQDLKNLIALLTFSTPYGPSRPTVSQLAHAMQVSETKVRARMRRLAQFLWQGRPLVIEIRRPSGLDAYALAPHVLARQEPSGGPAPEASTAPPAANSQPVNEEAASSLISVKDAIITHSRAKHARPREQVERAIHQQMGWPYPFPR